jgi:hypothetical protein
MIETNNSWAIVGQWKHTSFYKGDYTAMEICIEKKTGTVF